MKPRLTPLFRRSLALLPTLMLAGYFGTAQAADKEAKGKPAEVSSAASKTVESSGELTGQVLYQYLLAEIAASRGQLPLSASIYVDLARSTHDGRIARRATEVAYFGQQPTLALEAARIWVEQEPDSPQARQTFWTLLANNGKVDELSAAIAAALKEEGPNAGGALLLLNRMFARTQDKAIVQKLVNQVSEPYLTLPEAHFARAQAAVAANDEPAARRSIDEALRLKPDWEVATLFKAQLQAASPEQALATLDQLLDKDRSPKNYTEARLIRARLLVELKRYKEARQAFSQLLDQQPDSPELIYATGLLSLQLGDNATGEKLLGRLLDMSFSDKDGVHLYLGQAAEDQGKLTEALAHYDAVTPSHARYVAAQSRSAAILHSLNRDDESLERLNRALAANPKDKLQLLLAQAQLLSERGKEADAYTVLDHALEDQPEDPVLLYESSLMAEKIGKFDVLERNLRKLIKLQPDNAPAYNALGYSFVDRNTRLEEAQHLLDKALALAPNDPFIIDSRGWLDFRLGKLPEAETWLRKATALRSDAEFSAHLGEVLWLQGKQDEARKVWDAASKLDPRNELLNSTRKRLLP